MARSAAVLGVGALLLGPPAMAQLPTRLVPHDNAAGIALSIEGEGGPASPPANAAIAVTTTLERSLGRAVPGAEPMVSRGQGGTFAQVVRQFANDPGFIHLLLASDKGSAVCHLRARPSPEARDAIPAALQRCVTELARQATPVAAQVVPGNAPAQPDAPPFAPTAAAVLHPENWTIVEGVYFWGTTGIGVGGMVVIAFKPIVLFTDGRYYEIDDAPLENLDLAAEQRRRPRNWGRWTGDRGAYVLTDDKGRSNTYRLQDGRFFKAFPAEPGTVLDKRYSRFSGGGNSALGGEMTVAVSTRMTFARDGRFTTGDSVGAVGSGAQSGVGLSYGARRQMPAPGRYAVDRHTLVLTYPDGRTERRFFAFASSHTPPRLSRDMLFIGDRGYTSDD